MIDALVTGGKGFLGRALCARLEAEGQSVKALDRSDGDIADSASWNAFPKAKVLYHLAGRSYVPDSWEQGGDFVATNVLGTELALGYCRRHAAKMVYASAYVYGIPARLPINEQDPVSPNNPYALTKRLGEQLIEFAATYQGITATALRVFNVFGPGQRPEFLLPLIVKQIKEGKEIRLFDLSPKRDYIYLDDVIEAFYRAGRLESGFHLLNLGSGQSYSVGEIVALIQKVAGTSLPVFSTDSPRPQEIPDVVADISQALEVLNWRPQTSFTQGIQSMLNQR